MQGYGPFTATLQSIVQIPVDQSVTRVHFYNDSTFDCLVAVGTSKPNNKSTGLTDGWQAIVPAMHNAFVPTYGIAGSFYALPINSRTPSLAIAGTPSVLDNLWAVPLGPADTSFEVTPAIRQVDIASQQRVIALPCTPGLCDNGQVTQVATNTAVNLPLSSGTFSVAGFTEIQYYLYYAQVTVGFQGGATAGVRWQVQLDLQNGGGASYGFPFPQVLAEGQVVTTVNGDIYGWDFFPPNPVSYTAFVTPAFGTLQLSLFAKAVGGALAAGTPFSFNVLGKPVNQNSFAGPGGLGVPQTGGLFVW